MNVKTSIFTILFVFTSFFPVFCLDDEIHPVSELSICEKTVKTIKTQILANNPYGVTNELQQIEKMLRNNTVSLSEKEILSILMFLCYCDNPEPLGEEAFLIKKKSIELIGLLGKQSLKANVVSIAKDVLIDVLSASETVTISSLCIHSLGIIGKDWDGKAIEAINKAMEKQNNKSPNNLFALAVANAIEQIAIANNGIENWKVYVSLIYIVQGNYDEMVRNKAHSVIEKLRSYQ